MVQFITWLIIGTIIEHNGTTSLKLMYNLDFFTIKLNFLPNCITSSLSSRIMYLTFFCVPSPLSQSLSHCGSHKSALHTGNA